MSDVCQVCGVGVVDQVTHARFHRRFDAIVESLDHMRNILLAVEEDLEALRRDLRVVR